MSNYDDWNQAIAQFFFSPKRKVFLSCDRETLVTIAKQNPSLADDEPVKRFTEAVKSRLSYCGWSKGFCYREEHPKYLALLAFLVFCSFENEEQGKSKGRGFYETLAFHLDYPEGSIDHAERKTIAELWDSYEKWMNHTCQGKYGYVRLPTKRIGSWYIVNMITSQATMRDHDLRLLLKIFEQKRFEPSHVVEPALMARHLEELSPHIVRCLKDERRDAVIQQACEYLKNWDDTIPGLDVSIELPKNPALEASKVWCQILRRQSMTLEGGLVDPQLQSLSSVGTREDLVARLAKVDAKGLLTVFNPMCGRYEEARKFSEGDRFLFFMPHCLRNYWQEGLELFSNQRRIYSAENQVEGHHLARLPDGLCALFVEVKATLDQRVQNSHWAEFFETQNLVIELFGGLSLGKLVWLTGFGPRVSCNAVELYLDGELLPQGDVLQQRLNDAWSIPGIYVLSNWTDTEEITIRDPETCRKPVPLVGWRFCDNSWPELWQGQVLEASVNQLIGNNHKELRSQEAKMPLQRAWVDLNLQIRGLLKGQKQSDYPEHLLNRCLARAVQGRFLYGR